MDVINQSNEDNIGAKQKSFIALSHGHRFGHSRMKAELGRERFAADLNSMVVWNKHYLRELYNSGFIDSLYS